MVHLEKSGELAVAEVAFYGLAMLVDIAVMIRQGFSPKKGWFYIATLSILRLIGGAATIYIEVKDKYNDETLVKVAGITSAIGTAPLLLSLLGFLYRLNEGLSFGRLPRPSFLAIHLVTIVGLVVAVIGGLEESGGGSQSKVTRGHHLLEVSAVIFLVMWLIMAAMAVLMVLRRDRVHSDDSRMLLAVALVQPFMLVRLAYTMLVCFASQNSKFYFLDPEVLAEGLMLFAMEGFIDIIYLVSGALSPPEDTRRTDSGKGYPPVNQMQYQSRV